MSDTDESGVVLVEHPDDTTPPSHLQDEETTPAAVNIISIGSEENAYAFTFHAEKLNEILQRVPIHLPMAVISVVGAFRTGKSFLLSWFLRYLYAQQQQQQQQQEDSDDQPWYQQFESLGNKGFHWQSGGDRDTTGIWMWSHPHVLTKEDGSQMAILLVDTQGMFDHETTMSLTASIFGLSTLLSSLQIYNVKEHIQERDLQQLALFSEYAKIALQANGDKESTEGKEESNKKVEEERAKLADDEQEEKENSDDESSSKKPFQRIEFLVRDCLHFDDDEDDDKETAANIERMEQMMKDHLQDIMADREAKDLKETREQIFRCFEQVGCYGLCHPGLIVTKKKYSGQVDKIEPLFLKLLDRFCAEYVFGDSLQPKQIHGHTLTAPELGAYIHAYAKLFASGAKFPTAVTLLEATTAANNTNAIHRALVAYREEMDRVAGPNCTNWLKPDELSRENDDMVKRGLQVFESIANFGSQKSINEARMSLLKELEASFKMYHSLNERRNPLTGLETYFIPAMIAVLAVVLRWVTDMTCSPYLSICRNTSGLLSHTSAVIFCFLFIVATTKFKQIMDLLGRLKDVIEVMIEGRAHQKDD